MIQPHSPAPRFFHPQIWYSIWLEIEVFQFKSPSIKSPSIKSPSIKKSLHLEVLQSRSFSYVVSSASRIARSCWICICSIPLSIFTRHSLVIGMPCRFIIRTSSTCPIPLDFLIFLILCPIVPDLSCLIFCSVLSHPLNQNQSTFLSILYNDSIIMGLKIVHL